jgi:alkylation response protein AidB-like acyl-CoA dehydrogenase
VIDTWTSTGLRGTASHDYAVDDLCVPGERSCWFMEPPVENGPLYRMPPIAMFATFIGAVPLGIARHALDAFVELSNTKVPVLSQTVLADKPVANHTLGRATALVESAHAYLRGRLEICWQAVQAGRSPTLADRAALWLAATHAGHSSLRAVDLLYTAAGADSVYATSALDRCLRDVRTAVQHICTQELNFELAGRLAAGRVDDVMTSPWIIDYRGEGLG